MFISRVVQFCKHWYYSLDASKVADLESYAARLEKALDECIEEREYLIYLAESRAADAIQDLAWAKEDLVRERENFEYRLACKEEELQEYKLKVEEERQRRYQLYCPFCGTKRSGRCPTCDHVFGHN